MFLIKHIHKIENSLTKFSIEENSEIFPYHIHNPVFPFVCNRKNFPIRENIKKMPPTSPLSTLILNEADINCVLYTVKRLEIQVKYCIGLAVPP